MISLVSGARLKVLLEHERRESEHLKALLQIAEQNAQVERQERTRLQSEIKRLSRLLEGHQGDSDPVVSSS